MFASGYIGRSCSKGGVVVVVDAFFWGARLRRRNAFAMHHYGYGVGDDVGPALGVVLRAARGGPCGERN